jgi:hypothetical protein
VVTFLGLPIILFLLTLASEQYSWIKFNEQQNEYKFLVPYFNAVTALVFGLAGLNSWDKRLERNGNGNGNGSKGK